MPTYIEVRQDFVVQILRGLNLTIKCAKTYLAVSRLTMGFVVGIDHAEVAREATRADLTTWFQSIVERRCSKGLQNTFEIVKPFQQTRITAPLLPVYSQPYIDVLSFGHGAIKGH
jgi:hypothetical protein